MKSYRNLKTYETIVGEETERDLIYLVSVDPERVVRTSHSALTR